MINPHERFSLVQHLHALLEYISKIPTTTPCTACTMYENGICLMCKEKIPQDVIAAGCEHWMFDPDSMPF